MHRVLFVALMAVLATTLAEVQVGNRFGTGIQLGSDGESTSCSEGKYGMIRYDEDADVFEYCSEQSDSWQVISIGSRSINVGTIDFDEMMCSGHGTYIPRNATAGPRCLCETNYTSAHCQDCDEWIGRDINDDCNVLVGRPDEPYDGDLSVSGTYNVETQNHAGRSCADGGDAVSYRVSSIVNAASLIVNLQSTPSTGCLDDFEWVALHAMQGANAGTYELFRISSVVGSVVTMTYASNRFSTFTPHATDDVYILRRVPYYSSLVGSSATVTSPAWNGASGGVVMLRSGSISGVGTFYATGNGYRGGVSPTSNSYGQQGESYLPNSLRITAATDTSRYLAHGGAGGGANPGTPGSWWPMGGGGGSYGTAASTADNGGCGSTHPTPLGGATQSFPTGFAGSVYGSSDLEAQLFLGSGGGSGGRHNGHTPGNGGAGGGAIAVIVDTTLTGTWQMLANGNDGVRVRSSGGGGSGGSVYVVAPNSPSISTSVSGGSGFADTSCSRGYSGSGGNGRVLATTSTALFAREAERTV